MLEKETKHTALSGNIKNDYMNKENKKYFRSNISADVDENSRTIKGAAVVFDKWSRELGGFKERIMKGAITQELIENSDIIANYEHNSEDYMLARYRNGGGTLSLELTDDALLFEFEAPTTAKGDELLYHVRNGNIDECSFCFTISEDEGAQRWYKDDQGQLCRDIYKIGGLYDISMVIHAAYGDTYCYSRNQEEAKRALEIMDRSNEINTMLDSMIKELDQYKI